jgi:hypothetical protein
VLPFTILLTLGFSKAAAAAALLLVMVVDVVVVVVKSRIFVRAGGKDKLRRKCTTDNQKFGAKISLPKARVIVNNTTAVCEGTSRGNIHKNLRLSGSGRQEVPRFIPDISPTFYIFFIRD